MKKDQHNHFKNNIRRLFLLYAIVPVFCITLLCLIIFSVSSKFSLEHTTRIENEKMALRLEETLTTYIDKVEELADREELILKPLENSVRVDVFEGMYSIWNELDCKAYLYMFDENLNPIISATKEVPEYIKGNHSISWGIFRQMNKYSDTVVSKLVEDEASGAMQLLLGKAIMDKGKEIGYVVLAIDSVQFRVPIANHSSQTVITDKFGRIFVTNNYNFLDSMERFRYTGMISNQYISSEGNLSYITTTSLLDDSIYVYSIYAVNEQISKYLFIIFILVCVFLLMIICVFISTKQMAIKKTKDIDVITEAFEAIKNGDLSNYIHIKSNNEFQIIADSYNLMLDSLKEQIEANKEMSSLVATAQMKQLASQFNPHFLYNTLENIRHMCRLEPELASKMTFNLSTLLQYSISNVKEEVTVEEDIAYTENYMKILKYRFNQRFQYTIHIPEELKKCIIPKLIMQPLIENSVKYGFEGKDSIFVEVRAYEEDGKLILECKDNGIGINEIALSELRESFTKKKNTSNHSGLFNIYRRVQIRYGEEYGIQIISEFGTGTKMRIVLPITD